MKQRIGLLLLILGVGAAAGAYFAYRRPSPLVLTGVVTTNDVVVSPQIGGRIERLLINEGDIVKRDQLLAVIAPDELKADIAYYAQRTASKPCRTVFPSPL